MSAVLRGRRVIYATVPEAAEFLHVPEDTVRWRLRSGKLKGRKFGSRWRVLASDLRANGEVKS